MLKINPKKFKHIQNKTIPSPLRPKFRNSGDTNIYFLSKKKFHFKNNKTFQHYGLLKKPINTKGMLMDTYKHI